MFRRHLRMSLCDVVGRSLWSLFQSNVTKRFLFLFIWSAVGSGRMSSERRTASGRVAGQNRLPNAFFQRRKAEAHRPRAGRGHRRVADSQRKRRSCQVSERWVWSGQRPEISVPPPSLSRIKRVDPSYPTRLARTLEESLKPTTCGVKSPQTAPFAIRQPIHR